MNNQNTTASQNKQELAARISSSLQVKIIASDEQVSLSEPAYALNWFNVRYSWLYDFYNFVGTRSVRQVNGIPIFKATVGRTLHGDPSDYRDRVLIVRYPDAGHFKTMLENRYFQVVSLLRLVAVQAFTFALSQRTDLSDSIKRPIDNADTLNISTSEAYAIHHFRAEQNSTISDMVQLTAKKHGVKLGFSSQVSAHLYSQNKGKEPEVTPSLMTHCLILQADSATSIEEFIATKDYQDLIQATQSSFIALLKRHVLT